jgi:hypothetical protein
MDIIISRPIIENLLNVSRSLLSIRRLSEFLKSSNSYLNLNALQKFQKFA